MGGGAGQSRDQGGLAGQVGGGGGKERDWGPQGAGRGGAGVGLEEWAGPVSVFSGCVLKKS